MSPLSLERRLLRNCYRIATGFLPSALMRIQGSQASTLTTGRRRDLVNPTRRVSHCNSHAPVIQGVPPPPLRPLTPSQISSVGPRRDSSGPVQKP